MCTCVCARSTHSFCWFGLVTSLRSFQFISFGFDDGAELIPIRFRSILCAIFSRCCLGSLGNCVVCGPERPYLIDTIEFIDKRGKPKRDFSNELCRIVSLPAPFCHFGGGGRHCRYLWNLFAAFSPVFYFPIRHYIDEQTNEWMAKRKVGEWRWRARAIEECASHKYKIYNAIFYWYRDFVYFTLNENGSVEDLCVCVRCAFK